MAILLAEGSSFFSRHVFTDYERHVSTIFNSAAKLATILHGKYKIVFIL